MWDWLYTPGVRFPFHLRKPRLLGFRMMLRHEAGRIVVVALVVVVALGLLVFYEALLRPQVAFAGDRVALMSLKDLWVHSSAGFGLRAPDGSRDLFLSEYRDFWARASVRRLLKDDSAFSALASRANGAFSRLEAAELRGEAGAGDVAAIFDAALGDMAARVGDVASLQLQLYQTLFLGLGFCFLLLCTGLVALELRLRASSEGQERNRALSRALIAAQEGERLRISRELHDAVAQDLAAAKLYCGLAGVQDASRAGELLERAIEEVRGICYGLRPAEIDRLGISGAAARLCAEVGREMGIDVQYRVDGLVSLELEAETEITIYRILQEALTNIKRHAEARHIHVGLLGYGAFVELTVEDDGRGLAGSSPGLGRTGMEERAQMLGGTFRLSSGPWGGSLLRVTAPVKRKEAAS